MNLNPWAGWWAWGAELFSEGAGRRGSHAGVEINVEINPAETKKLTLSAQ